MYSMHNKEKFVVAERFIRTIQKRNHMYMTSISKNVNIDKLDDILNKYIFTYHSTVTVIPTDVKSNTYIDSSKEINIKYPKFKIDDIVRISKYNNIFAKCYAAN